MAMVKVTKVNIAVTLSIEHGAKGTRLGRQVVVVEETMTKSLAIKSQQVKTYIYQNF
jgi:hypothetical protein